VLAIMDALAEERGIGRARDAFIFPKGASTVLIE
jgi:hypothetical protein